MNNTTAAPESASSWQDFFNVNMPLIILGVAIICANAAILIVFIRKRPLRITTNYLLAAIAFSDLMAGLITLPTFLACNSTLTHVPCNISGIVFTFTSLCTISFIAVITVDRYVAIMKPLRYKALVTKKRIKIIITLVMVISTILSVMPFFWVVGKLHNPTADQRRADFIYTICILFPMVAAFPLMVFAYIRIFMEIRRQHKLDQEHERLQGGNSQTIEKEIRTVCVFVAMMLAYVFCWAPMAIIRVNFYISNSVGLLPPEARYTIALLPFVTSFLNPCCYGLGKKDFRSALSECCGCFRKRGQKQRRNNTFTTVC